MEIPQRLEVEARYARTVQRMNNRQRKRLRSLLGFPPDIRNVPPEFWTQTEAEIRSEHQKLLLLLFLSSATIHARAAGYDPQKDRTLRAQLEGAANGYADTRAAEIARDHTAGRQKALQRQADIWNRQAPEGTRLPSGDVTQVEIDADLHKTYGPHPTTKTVVTQTTNARASGGESGIGLTVGTSEDDLWINRPYLTRTGPCPVCKPLHRQPRSVWSLQFPEGPAAHDYCVCIIEYAFERAR